MMWWTLRYLQTDGGLRQHVNIVLDVNFTGGLCAVFITIEIKEIVIWTLAAKRASGPAR